MSADKTLDLASIRARATDARGRRYWQSLEEIADTEAFGDFVKREFPAHASEWLDPVGRRGFLKLMGASMALAGATACAAARRSHRSVRPHTRRRGPRQTALLRDDDDAGRRGRGPSGREP
jgi:molybdopterin-containing oxidoreductase family iron-sulfur binding subunit